MHADHRLIDIIDVGAQIGDQVGVVVGIRIPDRIRNIHRPRTSLDHRLHHFGQEFRFRTRCVFWAKFDVINQGLGIGDTFARLFDDFFFHFIQFKLAMNRAGRQENMNAGAITGGFDGFRSAIDVALQSTG